MDRFRPRSAFVEDVLGVSEREFRNDTSLVRKAWRNPGLIQNLSTGKVYKAGKLVLPTLASLRERTKVCASATPGTLSVLCGVNDLSKVDVGYLQAQPENRNAVFQVASNFNGLELLNMYDDRAMTEVGHYIHDRTQGPFASISAAPGLLMRHYYPFCHPDLPVSKWRQQYDGPQIQLLENTPFKVVNGYISLNSDDLGKPFTEDSIKVCSHREIQVTFGAVRGSEHALVEDPNQTVDQVFTATADLMGTNRHLFAQSSGEVETLVKRLLLAAYEGTLRSALDAGRSRVYLTLIGGGVFANPPRWIVDTILSQVPLIVDSGLTVLVNTYRGIADQAVFDKLVDGARKTGGDLVIV